MFDDKNSVEQECPLPLHRTHGGIALRTPNNTPTATGRMAVVLASFGPQVDDVDEDDASDQNTFCITLSPEDPATPTKEQEHEKEEVDCNCATVPAQRLVLLSISLAGLDQSLRVPSSALAHHQEQQRADPLVVAVRVMAATKRWRQRAAATIAARSAVPRWMTMKRSAKFAMLERTDG